MVAGRIAPGLVLRLPPNLNFALRDILRSRNNSVGDLLQNTVTEHVSALREQRSAG
jgi:hypothetical protein